MSWLTRMLYRFRYGVWLLVLAGVGGLWKFNTPVTFDQSIEGFFPPDHAALVSYQRAKQSFGGDDFVFVAYEDEELWTPAGMDRLRSLVRLVREHVSGVARVQSLDQMPLPWRVDAAVDSLVKLAPAAKALALPRIVGGLATVATEIRTCGDDSAALAELKDRLCTSPLFRNNLVDARGRTTALIVQLKGPEEADTKQAVTELRQHADAFAREHGLARAAVVGPPVLVADGFASLEKDHQTLGWVAMGLMALTMLIAVRSPWWAVLPVVSGCLTWQLTQAFLNTWDLKLTLAAGPIIAQTVVLCMPAASHLAVHFRESLRNQFNPEIAARQTLAVVSVPVAWCALTAAAGYLATLSSSVRPVYQFGLTMAVCNILAGLLAYVLAAGAMQPPRWLRRRATQELTPYEAEFNPKQTQLSRVTEWLLDHPGRTLTFFVAPCLVIAVGIGQVRFESNYIKIYKGNSRVAQDYRYVEQRLGGIGVVELVVPAPKDAAEVTAEWLEKIRAATEQLKSVDRELVGEVLTLADVLIPDKESRSDTKQPAPAEPTPTTERPKQSGILGGLLRRPAAGPVSPDQVIQSKLSILGSPVFSYILNNFWKRSEGQMRLIVRIRESADAEQKERAFEKLQAAARLEFGQDAYLTGLSHLMTQVTRAIITTQFQSTAWACAMILFMLLVALRSPVLAVFALFPTLLAVGLVLGAMGWLGVRIDMSTALVASVAAGLSVDDTFHCLLRWRREVRQGRPAREALQVSYAGAGPGVVLSSAAVSLGFLALTFSEFVPTANFGWLVAVATLGGSLGNLVVLPALLMLVSRLRPFGPMQPRPS